MKSHLRHGRVRGFSLIELMIALAIGLVVLAVLATVFSQTSSGRSELDRVSRLVENSRYAVDSIGDDVRHAGFYGTFLPPTDAVYVDASPCTWNSLDVATIGWQPSVTPARFPAPLQGWDDPAASGDLDCLPNRLHGTDVLAIRRVSSEPTAVGAVDAAGVYVQASQCIGDAVLMQVSHDASKFTLRTAACDATKRAGIRRYFVRVYYVASCNDCDANDGIPTLKRMERDSAGVRVIALAEGVENMQLEYGVDTTGSGEITSYRADAGAGITWADVVAVRAHLLVRSADAGATARTSPAAFDVGPQPAHQNVACRSGHKCRLVTTTMRLNNVAGRRES